MTDYTSKSRIFESLDPVRLPERLRTNSNEQTRELADNRSECSREKADHP